MFLGFQRRSFRLQAMVVLLIVAVLSLVTEIKLDQFRWTEGISPDRITKVAKMTEARLGLDWYIESESTPEPASPPTAETIAYVGPDEVRKAHQISLLHPFAFRPPPVA